MLFYWLDRKGWNIPADGQTIGAVRDFVSRGASYFLAERDALGRTPGFEAALRSAYLLLAECPEAMLFQLKE
jgi:hypothetical protein